MSEILMTVGAALWQAVLPSLATVLAGMLMLLLKRVLAKQGIELSDAQDQRLTNIVAEKIRAAEEWAHREEKAGNDPPPGEVKLGKVVTDTIATVKHDQTIPDPSPDKVRAIIDSTLPLVRRVLG